MTKLYVLFYTLLISLGLSYEGKAEGLVVYVSTVNFYTERGVPYTEIHYKVNTKGLLPNSKLLFTEIISQKDKMIYGDKFLLSGNLVYDSLANTTLNHLSRIKIPAGEYQVSIQIRDSMQSQIQTDINFSLKVDSIVKKPKVSKIVFCDSIFRPSKADNFTKKGLNFIPSILSSYSDNIQKINYYCEIDLDSLTLKKNKTVIVKRHIIDDKGYLLNEYTKKVSKKTESKMLNFEKVNISALPKGSYHLEILVMDEKENILSNSKGAFSKGVKIQVEGTSDGINALNFTDRLTKNYIIKYLDYLKVSLQTNELSVIERITQSTDSVYIKKMFYQIWSDRNPSNPYQEYKTYTFNIDFVQTHYKSAFLPGYKTDRGRTYLKHGKPDFITPYMDEPTAYPYEIWQYYSIQNQSNVKYIFYNPTGIDNDYILLHSTANREIKNPDWKKLLYKRDAKRNQPNNKGNIGDDADKRFNE